MGSQGAEGAVEVKWSPVAQSGATLTPRAGHSLVAVAAPQGPKVYALGGVGSSGAALPPSTAVQVLDSSQADWAALPLPKDPPSLPSLLSRSGHASAVVDQTIITFGGLVDGKTTSDLLVLDTASGAWDVAPPVQGGPPPARCHHSATAVGNCVFVFGGKTGPGEGATVLSDVWVLDWENKTWAQAAQVGSNPPPPALHSHSAALVLPQKERILVSGGASTLGGEGSADIWVLEVGTAAVKGSPKQPAVAWSKGAVGQPPSPVVICGPSGVGKGTLIAKLMAEFPDKCGFSVSHTTRKPRPGEEDGVHYNFSTRPEMEAEIAEGKFLEKADVHGNLYGTSVAAVQKVTASGKMCILDIDVQGAQQVKANPHISAVFIFVAPPSFEELERRLRGRGTETEEQVAKRLRNAKEEIEKGKDKALFKHTIVNDDLEAAYTKLKEILGLAETASAPEDSGPSPRLLHASASTEQGQVVLHGGLDKEGKGTPFPHMQVLDVSELSGGAPGLTWGVSAVSILPPPLSLWASILSVLGFLGESEAQGDGDPAPPRSSHQAVLVAGSQVLLVGGRLQDGVTVTSDCAALLLEKGSQ